MTHKHPETALATDIPEKRTPATKTVLQQNRHLMYHVLLTNFQQTQEPIEFTKALCTPVTGSNKKQ